jgi:hypothetical protein
VGIRPAPHVPPAARDKALRITILRLPIGLCGIWSRASPFFNTPSICLATLTLIDAHFKISPVNELSVVRRKTSVGISLAPLNVVS